MKNETLGLLLGVLFLFSAAALADTHVPGGFVSGTWTLAGSPYILDGSIVVHRDSALTIESGVDVLIAPARRFRIEGQILAVGTEQDSIRFIATDTTEGSEGLDFLNTNLSPRDSSRLVYCEIKYGTASPYPDPYMHGGGLYIKNSSRLLISHCTISHCRTRNVVGIAGTDATTPGGAGGPGGSVQAGHGGAIYCEASNPLICLNTISQNRTGIGFGGQGGRGGGSSGQWPGGLGGAGGSGTGGSGGAVYLKISNAIIADNMIADNVTGQGQGGIGGHGGNCYGWYYLYIIGGAGGAGGAGAGGSGGSIYAESSFATLQNNLFWGNNPGNGIGGTGGSGGDAGGYGYEVLNGGNGGAGGNGYGGNGLALTAASGSSLSLSNCTLAQSALSQGQGGAGGAGGFGLSQAPSGSPGHGINGSHIIYGSSLTMLNSILWNNASPMIDPQAMVTYSCIQGGFPGMGNISSDPLFVSAPQSSYFLSQIAAGQAQQSPCVDAGDPASPMIIGTTRTDGIQDAGILDMGYHYPLFTTVPAVSVTLTPYGIPIEIPATGGSFNYDISVANTGNTTVEADVWCMVTLPNGSPYGPTLGPFSLIFPAGFNDGRNRTQTVPGAAPSGNYTYHAYIGDYPGTIWDQDSFPFTKLSTGLGEWVGSWMNSGESFDEWLTADQNSARIPERYSLMQNVPNPFNPTTVIGYELPVAGMVSLEVYDLIGRRVADLAAGWRDAGIHVVTWDASAMPSGIYFCRIQAGDFGAVKKMMLVK